MDKCIVHYKISFHKLTCTLFTLMGKLAMNHINRIKNAGKKRRLLEIGPGRKRIENFETLNIVGGPNVDYVYDAAKQLPFKDRAFDLIYASHILEHIPWYQTKQVLKEWARIIKPGGSLEVWVPDGHKICKVMLEADEKKTEGIPDNWKKKNPNNCPYLWVNGRIFYGVRNDYPSWHKAIFSYSYLEKIFRALNFSNIIQMDELNLRGEARGPINLGIKGTKI